MAGRKSKTVEFIQPQRRTDWYGALDEIFSEAAQMPIEKFGAQLVYGNKCLEKYIDNIDPEFDASHRCTHLNTFYAATFTTFCVDDKERAIVTKQSAKRAFDAFHIGNRVLFNTFIYELLRDKDSVIRAFYGFMSEEEAQKLLEQPDQWLLRMDQDGFIITEAVSIAENGVPQVKNYRLIYDCGSFYMNGRTFAKLSDVTEVFPMELAYCSSPYFSNCYNGHPSYYADGDARYYYWMKLITTINKHSDSDRPHFRCMMWGLKVVGPADPKSYVQHCARAVCDWGTIPETIDVLKQCLKLGAEMNVSSEGRISIAEAISRSYKKEGRMEDLREFLWSNGFNPNSVSADGYPTFWTAASNRNSRNSLVTIWTLHPDLDINISFNGSGHVLHWSSDNIPTSVLAHPKININVLNSQGHTILDYAITDRNSETVAKYIQYGADAARTTSKLGSYLHLWIDTHNKSTDVPEIDRILQLLLDNGVKIDTMDVNGLTALQVAAQKGTIQIVKALLANGANINGHPDSETTPLHLAAERGDAEIVAYLLDQGADRTKRNSAGQLPKDVAALSAKELFDTDSTSLPQFSFKCKYLPIKGGKKQCLPFPRGFAQCFFVGEYLYIWAGMAWFLDWFDDYGYVSLVNQTEYTNTCWRTNISNTPLIWEEIHTRPALNLGRYDYRTCAPVEGRIWFNTSRGDAYAQLIIKGNLDRWARSTPSQSIPQSVLKNQMFDFGDRLLYPQTSSVGVYDKAKKIFNWNQVDPGDLDFQYLECYHSVTLARNSFWVKDKRSIFTMSLEKRRWLKSTTLPNTMDFVSFIVGFGDRFILALVRERINEQSVCKLMILDIDSGSRSYHDIEFDYKDYSMPQDYLYESLNERTIDDHRKQDRQQYETAKQKVLNDIANNNLPYDLISLAVRGTTLVLFGGALGDYMWLSSDVLTMELSSLKPYLSLEQLAGIEASMNNTYSKEQLRAVPTTLRSKYNLW